MLKALEQSLGIVTTACLAAGISRDTHYRWLNKDKKYAAAVKQVSEIVVDFAESHLFKQIRRGEVASTIFFLKTKARDRGYIEKRDVDVTSGGAPIGKPPIVWTDAEGDGEGAK